MTKWRYGDSWEKYPVKKGEIWTHQSSGSMLAVWDLFDGLPEFMTQADMIYTDPPWNTGNLRGFYTKSGQKTSQSFLDFTKILFDHLTSIKAKTCYLEIGKQNVDLFKEQLAAIYPCIQAWPITYYRKNPAWLVRGGHEKTLTDFTGLDDIDTPKLAMENENFSVIADLCMGRGLTAVTAYKLGKCFVGTELNPRRLACAIDKVGGAWHITQH